MNEQHKEIAKIIKEYLPEDVTNRLIVIRLSEYFERESKTDFSQGKYPNYVKIFNRKQFLKECGVR